MKTRLRSLTDELYNLAEECLPFIERHPFGKNLAHRMNNVMRQITVEKTLETKIEMENKNAATSYL